MPGLPNLPQLDDLRGVYDVDRGVLMCAASDPSNNDANHLSAPDHPSLDYSSAGDHWYLVKFKWTNVSNGYGGVAGQFSSGSRGWQFFKSLDKISFRLQLDGTKTITTAGGPGQDVWGIAIAQYVDASNDFYIYTSWGETLSDLTGTAGPNNSTAEMRILSTEDQNGLDFGHVATVAVGVGSLTPTQRSAIFRGGLLTSPSEWKDADGGGGDLDGVWAQTQDAKGHCWHGNPDAMLTDLGGGGLNLSAVGTPTAAEGPTSDTSMGFDAASTECLEAPTAETARSFADTDDWWVYKLVYKDKGQTSGGGVSASVANTHGGSGFDTHQGYTLGVSYRPGAIFWPTAQIGDGTGTTLYTHATNLSENTPQPIIYRHDDTANELKIACWGTSAVSESTYSNVDFVAAPNLPMLAGCTLLGTTKISYFDDDLCVLIGGRTALTDAERDWLIDNGNGRTWTDILRAKARGTGAGAGIYDKCTYAIRDKVDLLAPSDGWTEAGTIDANTGKAPAERLYTDVSAPTTEHPEGVALHGAMVARVEDVSGYDNHADPPALADQPAYDFPRRTIVPRGAGDHLVAPITLSAPGHVFAYGRVHSTSGGYLFDGDDGTDRWALFSSGGAWALTSGSSKSGGAADLDPHTFAANFGTSGELRVDGSSVATGNTGSNNLTGLQILSRNDGTGNSEDTSIRRIAVYAVAVSDGVNVSKAEGWAEDGDANKRPALPELQDARAVFDIDRRVMMCASSDNFDTSRYIGGPVDSSLDYSAGMKLWWLCDFRPASFSNDKIAGHYGGAGNRGWQWNLGSSGTVSFALELSNSRFTPALTIPSGQWCRAIATYDNTTNEISIYANHDRVGASDTGGLGTPNFPSSIHMKIGDTDGGNPFDVGRVATVAVGVGELTATQREALFRGGLFPMPDEWQAADGTGSDLDGVWGMIQDAKGHCWHGNPDAMATDIGGGGLNLQVNGAVGTDDGPSSDMTRKFQFSQWHADSRAECNDSTFFCVFMGGMGSGNEATGFSKYKVFGLEKTVGSHYPRFHVYEDDATEVRVDGTEVVTRNPGDQHLWIGQHVDGRAPVLTFNGTEYVGGTVVNSVHQRLGSVVIGSWGDGSGWLNWTEGDFHYALYGYAELTSAEKAWLNNGGLYRSLSEIINAHHRGTGDGRNIWGKCDHAWWAGDTVDLIGSLDMSVGGAPSEQATAANTEVMDTDVSTPTTTHPGGVALDGASIRTREDVSGQDNHESQSVIADQPRFNLTGLDGGPGLLFDRSGTCKLSTGDRGLSLHLANDDWSVGIRGRYADVQNECHVGAHNGGELLWARPTGAEDYFGWNGHESTPADSNVNQWIYVREGGIASRAYINNVAAVLSGSPFNATIQGFTTGNAGTLNRAWQDHLGREAIAVIDWSVSEVGDVDQWLEYGDDGPPAGGPITTTPDKVTAHGRVFEPTTIVDAAPITTTPDTVTAHGRVFDPSTAFAVEPDKVTGHARVFAPTTIVPVETTPDLVTGHARVFDPATSLGDIVTQPALVSAHARTFDPTTDLGGIFVEVDLVTGHARTFDPVTMVEIIPDLVTAHARAFSPVTVIGERVVATAVRRPGILGTPRRPGILANVRREGIL